MDEIASNTRKQRIRDFAERWRNVFEIAFTAVLAVFSVLLYCANRDYANTAKQAQRP